MAVELENISIRPVKGGYIIGVSTRDEYVDDEGERHSDWNNDEIVALTKEAALKIVSDNLPGE